MGILYNKRDNNGKFERNKENPDDLEVAVDWLPRIADYGIDEAACVAGRVLHEGRRRSRLSEFGAGGDD